MLQILKEICKAQVQRNKTRASHMIYKTVKGLINNMMYASLLTFTFKDVKY